MFVFTNVAVRKPAVKKVKSEVHRLFNSKCSKFNNSVLQEMVKKRTLFTREPLSFLFVNLLTSVINCVDAELKKMNGFAEGNNPCSNNFLSKENLPTFGNKNQDTFITALTPPPLPPRRPKLPIKLCGSTH